MRKLTKECLIKKPIEEVFSFFSKAENLDLITPEELQFRILTPLPVNMQKGALIDYKIKIYGVPFKWRTEITEWLPPFKFVDTQIKGPYSVWMHTHTFTPHPEGTIVKDEIEYLSRGWILEPFIQKLFVKKNLEHIFDYRQKKLKLIFNS